MNVGSIRAGAMVAGEILSPPWPDPMPGRPMRAWWPLARPGRTAAQFAKVAAGGFAGMLLVPLACAGGAMLAVLMLPVVLPVLVMSRLAERR